MTGYMENTSQVDSAPDARWQDRRSHHTLSRLVWASILIYAGLIFLADAMGYLPTLRSATAWDWVKLGVGGLLLLEGLIRAFSTDHPEPNLWRLIIGVMLIGWGAAAIFNIQLTAAWWPVVLIIIGISALARGLRR